MDGSSSNAYGSPTSSPTLRSPSSSLQSLHSASDASARTNFDGIELNKHEENADFPMSTPVRDPTPKDVLDHLDDGAKRAIQVADLMASATASLEPIRTLYNTDHPQLKPFKKDINRAVGDFLEAVESSTETAQLGVTFATNIGYLLVTLSDQQLCDSDRNQFMKEVEQIGVQAVEDAKRTCEAFDDVQRSFHEIVEKMKQRATRKEAKQTFGQEVKALQDFAVRVRQVFESAQQFVVWWTDMKVVFFMWNGALVAGGNQPMSRSRTDLLRRKWEAVGERFLDYNREIALLKPQFPRPSKTPSLWDRLKPRGKKARSK